MQFVLYVNQLATNVLAMTSREEETKGEKSFMRENVKYKNIKGDTAASFYNNQRT